MENKSGIGFSGLLTVAFIVLKLLRHYQLGLDLGYLSAVDRCPYYDRSCDYCCFTVIGGAEHG